MKALPIPCWTLADPVKVERRGLIEGVHLLDNTVGDGFLPLFSNEEMADRLIQELSLVGIIPVRIDRPDDLRQLLAAYEATGGIHATINPRHNSGGPNIAYPVRRLLDHLEAGD
jgi:hypothetical protein